jgi:uncharacterized phage infection (PIP) family protein YhgE
MTAQSPKSPDSPTPKWTCTGVPTNRHGEAINNQFKCKYCARTYDDYLKEHKIEIFQKRLLSSSGIAAIAALFLVISAIVYAGQKFAEADRAISQLKQTKAEVAQVNANLEKAKQELEKAQEILKRVPELEKSLAENQTELESTKSLLQTTQSTLEQTNKSFTQTKDQLQRKNQQIAEGNKCVKLMREIDNVTWQGAALNPDAVMRIQLTLQSVGFYQGEIDGTFAEITRKAVNNFQQDCQAKLERQ